MVLVVDSPDDGIEDCVEKLDIDENDGVDADMDADRVADADADFELEEAMLGEDAIEDAPVDLCMVELRDTPAEVVGGIKCDR